MLKEVFTTITSAFGVIAALYGLYRWFGNRMRLRAQARISEFNPYPTAQKDARKYARLVDDITSSTRYDLDVLIPEDQKNSKAAKALDNAKKLIQQLIVGLPKSIFGDYEDGAVFELKNYWEVEINNDGQSEVKDLILALPHKGYCRIDRPGEEGELKPFDKRITIGAMRSKDQIKVEVWTDSKHYEYLHKTVHLTHAAGSIAVKMEKRTLERPMWVSFLRDFGLFIFLYTVAMAWQSFHSSPQKSSSEPATQSTSQPTTKAV